MFDYRGVQGPARDQIRTDKALDGIEMPTSQKPPEKMMFQLNLRRRGISDQAVLRAMEEIPRDLFVAAADRADAWRDSALGIACGQTISQPLDRKSTRLNSSHRR